MPLSVQPSIGAEHLSNMSSYLRLLTLAFCILAAWSCEYQNGCRIYKRACQCEYGCRSEYIYKTRRDCSNALKAMLAAATAPPAFSERSSDICANIPCYRGICTQTSNDPGFACKCEGTGFYGKRCEKACPLIPVPNMVFPHECIVI